MASPLQEHQVVPDVIDEIPPHVAQVTYDSNIAVEMGQTLTPTQVQHQPAVSYPTDHDAFYTICMTDPDAPSRDNPRYREWHHWLVVNIPGTGVAQGETLSQYIGACPPRGTGLHRYVVVVYKQPGKLSCDEKRLTDRSGERRCNFKIRDFAKKYNLGEPVAVNFYLAEYDTYVSQIYDQLSGD